MKTYATKQEFLNAFAALPANAKLAIEVYANRCLSGTRYSDPMDIIHEVICRVLDGRRHWPRDLDVSIFIVNSVKSVASGDRQRMATSHDSLDSLQCHEDEPGPLPYEPVQSAEESAMASERHRIFEDARSFAQRDLSHDADALRVLNGLCAGLTPKEMKDTFRLDDKEFAAARQRVMTRLKTFGRKHSL